MAGVAEQAGQVDAALRGVVAWANWRLLSWLASSGALWWDTGAIQAARAEKAQLQAEVAEMQASRDEWAKAGFLSKLGRCNPGNRFLFACSPDPKPSLANGCWVVAQLLTSATATRSQAGGTPFLVADICRTQAKLRDELRDTSLCRSSTRLFFLNPNLLNYVT